MSKQSKQVKRIRWCFRASLGFDAADLSDDAIEEEATRLYGELIQHCEIFIFQLESAPTTGYLHFQGYLELETKNRFCWIQNNIRKFEYLTPAKGSPKQNWAYCSKHDTQIEGPWSLGTPRAAESENKTEQFVKAVKEGKTNAELWDDYPSFMTRYRNAVHDIRGLKHPVREFDLEVYVIYGPPGTGKSRWVRDMWPTVIPVPFGQKVWLTQNMSLAEVVLFEDFDGNMPLKQFNRMIDRYPEEVETKGGFVWWMPNTIYITTNTLPSHWYPDDGRQDTKAQIWRRITACYDTTGWVYDLNNMPKPMTVEELELKYAPKDLGLVREITSPKPKSAYVWRKPPNIQRPAPYRYDHGTKTLVKTTPQPTIPRLIQDEIENRVHLYDADRQCLEQANKFY